MTAIDYSDCIFVVGCARSGTTLMASILGASSEIATYRAETKLLDGCREKYGDLKKENSKSRFLKDWLRSRQFVRSGLARQTCIDIVGREQSYIGVLAAFMRLVAENQGKSRWVDSTPTNGYCLDQIGKAFPNAKVIHMIRDGRAVSASLAKLGWTGVATKNSNAALQYSALTWKHATDAILTLSQTLGSKYTEIRYEELVNKPMELLPRIFQYLNLSETNFEKIVDGTFEAADNRKSSLIRANSPYRDVSKGISAQPAKRWLNELSPEQIAAIELACGTSLTRLGYEPMARSSYKVSQLLLAHVRRHRLGVKRWLKFQTPLGRFSHTSLEVGAQ